MKVPVLDIGAENRALGSEIDAAIARVIESGAFIGGPDVAAFERELAAYVGVRHAVGVGNGTDALELALEALGIGPGDCVLTVPFTFAATLEAIVRVGATPVLVDIRDDDFTIDVEAAARAMAGGRIKAVIAVHLYGHPADMEGLLHAARAHGVAVIEDAAQAHGALCSVGAECPRAGAIGDIGCFSFYPTKNLGGMGDGGAVVTSDDRLAARLRLLANHGDAGKYEHVLANGRNSRLDTLQAAVLRVKLPHLDCWNAARRGVAARYTAAFAGLPLRLPYERAGCESVYHQYAVRVRERDRVREMLAAEGVATGIHYPCALHQQAGFRHLGREGGFPVAERCAAEVLCLPMSPHFSDEQVEHVIAALQDAVRRL